MSKEYQPKVALDFDGVLHQYSGWNEGRLNGPIAGAREAVEALTKLENQVVIFSTRDVEVIRAWLDEHGFRQRDFPPIEVTRTKPLCKVLLDDRAIRFDGRWSDDLIRALHEYKAYWE
jgi:hypothetical protein